VHLKFKLQTETLFLCINYLDRFLQSKAVSRHKLQLIGATALLIAAKYEEIYAPEIDDFVMISDSAFDREQLLQMESLMLTTLEFNVTVPTSLRFAERALRVSKCSTVCANLAQFFAEMSLQDYNMLKYLPSRVAASALYVAQRVAHSGGGTPSWSYALQSETGYSEADMLACARDQLALATRPNPKFNAVRRKYAHKKYLEVSKLPSADLAL